MKALEVLKGYLGETRQELTKVTWPDRKKVMALVSVIAVILVIVALYVFLVDNVLSFLIKNLERIRLY